MSDIELLFCTVPAAPALIPLLDRVSAWETPEADREQPMADLRALVADERSFASSRWTPHYDRALTALATAEPRELLEPWWDYGPDPVPQDRWYEVRNQLQIHTRLCSQLADAERCGARTLAGAFDTVVIGSDELADWLALHPDPAAFDARLRKAACRYLEIGRTYTGRAIAEHRCAVRIHEADHPSLLDLTYVPLELIALLGNPFDPMIRA